ncbi:MAG: hypothetical protein R3C28_18455 [Pirellulaceae bacterium]
MKNYVANFRPNGSFLWMNLRLCENRNKAWLWVAVAPLFAVFGIFADRSRDSLVSLVGNYQGIILNCDRAKMYLDGKRLNGAGLISNEIFKS